MDIQIRNSSDDPIYLQIRNQLKRAIVTGELAAGEQLLSIRLLAKELRISIITTKRIYDELGREGFANPVVGKGSLVAAQDSELLREEYLCEFGAMLRDALRYAALAQLSRIELLEMIDLLGEEPGRNEREPCCIRIR